MVTKPSNRKKISQFIVFKRKIIPNGEKLHSTVTVRCQVKRWMDNTPVVDWIKFVWEFWPGAFLKLKNTLEMES